MAYLLQEWGRLLPHTNEEPDFSSDLLVSERWWDESLQAEEVIEPTPPLLATWVETKTVGGSYKDVMDLNLKVAVFRVDPKWTEPPLLFRKR